jgi:CspA family cold shock protein
MKGVVKTYDGRRGAGRLTPDGGGQDVDVFVGEVERAGLVTLEAGQRIGFAIQTDRLRKRSFAVRLELL